MQCKCGGETTPRTHEVKTLAGALKWLETTTEDMLPLKVEQEQCIGCGRLHRKVFSAGELLKTTG